MMGSLTLERGAGSSRSGQCGETNKAFMTAAVKGASCFKVKLIYYTTAVNDLDSYPRSETVQTTLSPACVFEAQ